MLQYRYIHYINQLTSWPCPIILQLLVACIRAVSPTEHLQYSNYYSNSQKQQQQRHRHYYEHCNPIFLLLQDDKHTNLHLNNSRQISGSSHHSSRSTESNLNSAANIWDSCGHVVITSVGNWFSKCLQLAVCLKLILPWGLKYLHQ